MAKAASLILAVAIWFLISDLLENQSRAGVSQEEDSLLPSALNPDLQGDVTNEGPESEKTTVH
jgi:hypothetical protein